jgi:hypothetical protein
VRRAVLAALLAGVVAAGVVACTRVVVLEDGPAPDASLPIDDANSGTDDADDAIGDAATADASDIPDAL